MGVTFSPTGEFFSSVGLDEQVNIIVYLLYNITLDPTGTSVENQFRFG